jgi:hypothetical protein
VAGLSKGNGIIGRQAVGRRRLCRSLLTRLCIATRNRLAPEFKSDLESKCLAELQNVQLPSKKTEGVCERFRNERNCLYRIPIFKVCEMLGKQTVISKKCVKIYVGKIVKRNARNSFHSVSKVNKFLFML